MKTIEANLRKEIFFSPANLNEMLAHYVQTKKVYSEL